MMSSSMQLTRMEGKLFLREPMLMFFGLLFPSLVLVALGYLFPGFDEVEAEFGGLRAIDIYTPMIIALGLALLGLTLLPSSLSSYRQLGVLRRFRTTPVHPGWLLWAQLAVYGVVAIVIAFLAFDVHLPSLWGWYLIAFLLALTSIFTIGLLVSALARTAATGQAIGFALFFPMLFLAGMWVPRPLMSDELRTLSDLSPLGAAVQAMTDAWAGVTPSATHLVVMAAYAIVCGFLAVRFFRWE